MRLFMLWYTLTACKLLQLIQHKRHFVSMQSNIKQSTPTQRIYIYICIYYTPIIRIFEDFQQSEISLWCNAFIRSIYLTFKLSRHIAFQKAVLNHGVIINFLHFHKPSHIDQMSNNKGISDCKWMKFREILTKAGINIFPNFYCTSSICKMTVNLKAIKKKKKIKGSNKIRFGHERIFCPHQPDPKKAKRRRRALYSFVLAMLNFFIFRMLHFMSDKHEHGKQKYLQFLSERPVMFASMFFKKFRSLQHSFFANL